MKQNNNYNDYINNHHDEYSWSNWNYQQLFSQDNDNIMIIDNDKKLSDKINNSITDSNNYSNSNNDNYTSYIIGHDVRNLNNYFQQKDNSKPLINRKIARKQKLVDHQANIGSGPGSYLHDPEYLKAPIFDPSIMLYTLFPISGATLNTDQDNNNNNNNNNNYSDNNNIIIYQNYSYDETMLQITNKNSYNMINNKTPMNLNQMSLNKNDNSSSRSIRRIMNRISSK